jgi:DNA-binding protein H-NS
MNLNKMSVDGLLKLKEEVDAILNSKVAEERRAVQDKLNMLDRLAGGGSRAKGVGRGVRGPVAPKYRNPDDPSETWAGRGLKPRWLQAALKSGKKLEDLSVGAQGKTLRGRRKKA